MPPRYAYWTILIDNRPTAFRAREKEEMLPTFHQLRRTNKDVVLKWFARGRLWDTPEAAQAAGRETAAAREKRGSDWRPGGAHQDPRDRFRKKAATAPRGDRPSRDRPDARPPQGAVRARHPSRPSRPGSRDRR